MSVSGPDVGFTDFTGLGKGHRGYAHTLTSLFNQCDFGTVETHRHTISFKEASKRLRKQMTESFEYIEIQTGRMVKEFNIGKTHVYSQYAVDFNPSQPTTWATYGGLPISWENYKKKGFDGMIALGCVIKDIIPKVIRETNKALEMNSHSYAAGLAQSLVQYYLLQNPDDRLRSVTVEDLGNKSGKDELGSPASVIYVAYKLEPKTTNAVIKPSQMGVITWCFLGDKSVFHSVTLCYTRISVGSMRLHPLCVYCKLFCQRRRDYACLELKF
ncbi:unnamed protein product [Mytilus edulis]|uniref:Uncharacterized protein n=1 Tax=Mytilus edulis TaxID=6550 RepID=A0A8S3PMV1_MYTED|nr:unnamed protein product [Mytilus edulis]